MGKGKRGVTNENHMKEKKRTDDETNVGESGAYARCGSDKKINALPVG